MATPLARRPEAGGASPQVVPVGPGTAEYAVPASLRGIGAQAAGVLGLLGATFHDARDVTPGVPGHHEHPRSGRNTGASHPGRQGPRVRPRERTCPARYLLRPWRSPLLPGKSGPTNRPGRPPVAETFG